jgi:hypothetical protein
MKPQAPRPCVRRASRAGFYRWLFEQVDRQDTIGRLAREVKEIQQKYASPFRQFAFILRPTTIPAWRTTAARAYVEYERQRRGNTTTVGTVTALRTLKVVSR